ncbi:hypothetical protein KC332_g2027 [Hortaea werneckii]|uniref:Extracellular membrane protein CFEM domain-containing protein n=2 Tax=Hortaea werneckii TaxID=91943 RepID=A0A3M7IIJ5_HORWE|nr:hypothetical protein KC350_g12614 [Hortaea werneckii]OTA30734.1 hypothetical protein BTJ68_10419 [Hortaea werneckii EXF-2000]KAI6828290.1 hypothetical protein KC342_g9570 [Hortaea werneckii]KAI6848043.1 hypothetical protein KC358_g2007 [Hortaea werneckii]KAI6899823.1 hypothetical protein KC348_g17025 [Hortaea werneckii]
MFSKTFALTAVAAFATQTAAFTMPDCWSSCFAKHNVTGQEGLCRNSVVNNCIGYACHATNATAAAEYTTWLAEYCSSNSSAPASSSAPVYTTSAPLYTATPVASVSAAPVPYSNSTSMVSYYTKPALSTGASASTKSASSPTGSTMPFTGGAGSTAASLVLVAGGLAAHVLL